MNPVDSLADERVKSAVRVHILSPLTIVKVLVIKYNFLSELWVRLKHHKVLDTVEHDLEERVVVKNVY